MRTISKRKSKLKQAEVPQVDFVAPAPVKRPPPTLYLFHNQVGLGNGFQSSRQSLNAWR